MYGVLLRAFPREFREQFGAEMTALFGERRRDARRAGVIPYAGFLCRTLIDMLRHGVAERRDMKRKQGDSPVQSFLQDIRFAFRLFRQRPGFTASAVLTLALGIGINVAAFSVVNGVLIRWLAFPNPEQVVRLAQTNEESPQPLTAAAFRDLKQGSSGLFQSLASYLSLQETLTGAGIAKRVAVTYTTPELFDVIGLAPLMGRPLTPGDVDASTAVISARFWRGQLGSDPLVLGKTIDLDAQTVTIVGVMQDDAQFPATTDLWRPLILTPEQLASTRRRVFSAVGRLKAGTDVTAANAVLATVAATLPGYDPKLKNGGAMVLALREDTVGDIRSDLLFIQAIAVVVLLIGCANVANLLLAAAAARQHELSIRASIGAGRRRLVRQLLAESLVLSGVGGVAGVIVAAWLMPVIVASYPGQLPGIERIAIRLPELFLALGAAVGTTLLFGLTPALLASRTDLSASLRSGPTTSPSRAAQRFRWALIATEVAMTLSLLAGGALLVRNYARLTMQTVGFDPRSVITAQIVLPAGRYPTEAARRQAFDELVERVRQQPGVLHAATTTPLLFDGTDTAIVFSRPAGESDQSPAIASVQSVSQEYLQVLKIPLLRGRFFDANDTVDSPRVLVVTEQFAQRYAKGRDVLGMQVVNGDRTYEVVGVVGDWRLNFYQQPKPYALLSTSQEDVATSKIAVRVIGDPNRFTSVLRDIVGRLDPKLPVSIPISLEQVVAKSVALRRFNMGLLVGLSSLALVLAVIGIYGVMSYVVGQREREIGIRMALGAAPGSVSRLMVRQGLKPTLVGIAAGLVGAWYLTSLLKSELFKTTPHDPWPLAIAVASLLLVSVAACWIPSRRSARINPVEALRNE